MSSSLRSKASSWTLASEKSIITSAADAIIEVSSIDAPEPGRDDRPTVGHDALVAIRNFGLDNDHLTKTYPDGGLRAWLVVAGSSLTLFSTFGFLIAIGALQDYWTQNQLEHYPVRDIGWISGLLLYLWLAAGLVIGPLFDRFGPRWLMVFGSVCFVAMFFLLAESTEFWQFVLSCSVIGGISGAALTTSALGTIANWFDKRRGFAQGIGMAGSSLGGLLIPIVLRQTFPTYGYAWSMRILGFMTAFCLALGNILVKSNPRNLPTSAAVPQQTPWASDSEASLTSSSPPATSSPKAIISFKIFNTPSVLLFALSVVGLETVLFLAQVLLPTYATLQPHYPEDTGFYALAVCNGASCLGRLGPGYVSDRFGRFNTLLCMIFFTLIFTAVLWLPFGHTSLGALYAFSALFGFGTGSWMALIPACIGQLCPEGEFGRYYGAIYFVASFATLVAVPVGGELLAAVGNAGMIGFCCAVLGLSWVLFGASRWACLGRRMAWKERI